MDTGSRILIEFRQVGREKKNRWRRRNDESKSEKPPPAVQRKENLKLPTLAGK
jgi:hypothetical protein